MTCLRGRNAFKRLYSSVPAAALAAATADRKLIDLAKGGLPRLDYISSVEAAYKVQSDVIDSVTKKHGATLVGWKIGATNGAAQQRMGLATPFYGPVFMHNLRLAPASVSIGSEGFRIRGVEAEYAFLIGEDLPKRGDNTEYSAEDVGDAVAAVYPVIEVCGSRFTDNPPSSPINGVPQASLLSIADQASHGCLVRAVRLVKPKTMWDQLTSTGFSHLPVRLFINNKEVAVGSGADVLGNPLTALTWLANALQRTERPLRAGDIVTSGTMTGLTQVKADDSVIAEFTGFGTIQLNVQP